MQLLRKLCASSLHPEFAAFDYTRRLPDIGEPGSISDMAPTGFSHVGIGLDYATAQRVFSGFPVPRTLRSGAAPYSPRFTLIGSQDLAVKSRSTLCSPLHNTLCKMMDMVLILCTVSSAAAQTTRLDDNAISTTGNTQEELAAQAIRTIYFTVLQYYKDIKTIDDVEKDNLMIALPTEFGNNMTLDANDMFSGFDSTDEKLSQFIKLIILMDTLEEALSMTKIYRNITTAYIGLGAVYEVSKPENYLNNSPLLHITDPHIFSLYCVAQFREGFPLQDLCDSVMWWINEAGIILRNRRYYLEKNNVQVQQQSKVDDDAKPLRLESLQLYFYILLLLCVYFTQSVDEIRAKWPMRVKWRSTVSALGSAAVWWRGFEKA
ncbi:hypothetical protein PR048_014802 [Dryococelus australis]|uniref:Uncharacterized protein n=1 Tax=Dryococelus australis TaxID=614101 RepID=A0ABQ9HF71_9NEOP|nr:hypothetical protein PR048_014802 [Dryococelus australis]